VNVPPRLDERFVPLARALQEFAPEPDFFLANKLFIHFATHCRLVFLSACFQSGENISLFS